MQPKIYTPEQEQKLIEIFSIKNKAKRNEALTAYSKEIDKKRDLLYAKGNALMKNLPKVEKTAIATECEVSFPYKDIRIDTKTKRIIFTLLN